MPDIDYLIDYNDTLAADAGHPGSEIVLEVRGSDVAGYNGDNQHELVDKMLLAPRIQEQLAKLDPEYLRQHLNWYDMNGDVGTDHDENLRQFLGGMLETFRCNIAESGDHGFPRRPLKISKRH